ncbi:putative uncharacterized protein DDB_G0289041 isoform X2 [Plodia interpunctella]|uniref:putative uncharacterized protein DDB_G0289041 isoform X2 n=1 Tax=Plodia interpunctella TaxID=58824 RepID=UPI002367FE4F|nr:putative uncharacterized protein DDB_G0289041 isoform X2 [Plodia interpunctella]
MLLQNQKTPKFNNDYISKGKLGFAIIKITKSGFHNVVLYDSNKTPLSSTTVSSSLEISVKNNVYISYFDNMQKYWNLYSTEEEVKKIVNILKTLNAVVKYTSDNEKGPPVPIKKYSKAPLPIETQSQIDRESDTDSTINKRTKQSILNRMANMGHSVLPQNTATEKTSDSSDTNNSNNYSKTLTVRHKPVKGNMKRNSTDKSIEMQSLIDAHKTTNIENTPPLYTFVSGQLVPITTTNMMTTSNNSTNELNMFMSEQRVNSSEMRINITRMTDKVDQVLSKVSDLAHECTNNLNSNFQNEIFQKLLHEYETKIKVYEELIKKKDIDKNSTFSEESTILQPNNEIELLNKKLSEALDINKSKDSQIFTLQSELTIFKEKFKSMTDLKASNFELFQENQRLKQESEKRIYSLNDKNCNDKSIEDIKNILNNTFHSISANFDSDEHYMGETIKSIVANVIKTAFENLKQEKS